MNNEINNFLNLLNDKYFYTFIKQKIRYFSSSLSNHSQNQLLFSKHKYNPEIIKSFNDDIITQFFMLYLNKIMEEKKDPKYNNDIIFISSIIGKLYVEKIITENVVIKIGTYLLENQKFEPFFELLSISGIGQLLNEIKDKKLNSYENMLIRNILIQNSKYIKNILLLDPEKYEPFDFISSLFEFKFNLDLLNIDLFFSEFQFNNKNYLTKNYIINIFRTLLSLFEKEEKSQKLDLIRGLYTIDGFKYSNKIQLIEKFSINLHLKIYVSQKTEIEEYTIFNLYKDDKNELIKLYFDDKFNLKLKYVSSEFMILIGKNMDLNHIHSIKIIFVKESGWLNNYKQKIKVILNGQEQNFESNNLIDGEECSISFGQFNGELMEFNIMNNKKEIFKINFLSLFNIYKNNTSLKEIIIDHQNSKLIKLDEENVTIKRKSVKLKRKKTLSNLNQELNFADYFFENKKTIIKFLDEYGLECLSTLLIKLNKEVSNNIDNTNINIKDIYEVLTTFWTLFQYLYNILIKKANEKDKKYTTYINSNKYYLKRLMNVLYSYSILQGVLSERMKMPENLINKIVDFLKILSENNTSLVTKSFFNHILMIILTQQNTYNIPIDKISSFLNNLIASKELHYYLDCYISILIDLFFNQRKLKEIKKILSMFIENFTDAYLIKYIIIFQQFSLNKKDKVSSEENREKEIEENNNNYHFSYKLLKLIYNSKICEKTNIVEKSDTDIILYNFQKIFLLSNEHINHNNDKDKEKEKDKGKIKYNENVEIYLEKSLISEQDSEQNASEENDPNYLTRLKAISIRIIDLFIIKKYQGMRRKSIILKDEKYNRVKNSIAILFSMSNLDLYIIRSFLLTSFDTPNEHGLRFIKHGLGNDGINISELKLIENFTSIKFMFSIFDILRNKSHKKYYFDFIKLFINETMKKIRLFANSNESITISYKKTYSMNIFDYNKLGILLYNIIVELKRMPDNVELNFNDDYLVTVIENILFLHPNPFFYSLIIELIKD